MSSEICKHSFNELDVKISTVVAVILGLLFFGIWMSIVGNPHVVETVIGLVMALGIGLWAYRMMSAKTKR